ncbi:MAG TPA: succinate dehydrogenase, hydrophobic membrane anchor protein, partial [Candidatus Acidoferrales bacterium]|nr:succinate dehydrogenase, hydrophobic membrane anchor protein [Candidatus Acidoferrales bacterium]
MTQLSAAGGRVKPGSGLELYAWFFMRVSGILLLVLALGHLAIMHLIHNVDEVNFAFVAGRWANPLWRLYDWLLLMLAVLHGCNGLRVVVDDYVHSAGWRMVTQVAVFVVTILFLIAGSLAILIFNPAMGG